MNFDFGTLGASVCALSCVCLGSIAFIGVMAVRVFGLGVLPIVAQLLGGLLGNDDIDKRDRDRERRYPQREDRSVTAAQSLRERARATSFDDALQQHGGAISAQMAQSDPLQIPAQSAAPIQPGLSPRAPQQRPGFAPLSGQQNPTFQPSQPGLRPSPSLSGQSFNQQQTTPTQGQLPPYQPAPNRPSGRNLPSLSQASPSQPGQQGDYRPPMRRSGGGSRDYGSSGSLRGRDSRRRENNRIYDDNDMDGFAEFFDL